MTASVKTKPDLKLSTDDVAEWLLENPEFFQEQTALVEDLKVHHPTQGAVSLIEHQVSVLRHSKKSLQDKLAELIELANDNERLSNQLHSLSLALIEADTLDSVLSVAREQLNTTFDAEAVSIRLFKTGTKDRAPYFVNARDISKLFSSAYRTHNPLCGTLNKEQNDLVFPDVEFDVKSSVFIPLNEGRPIGFLAMASAKKSRFRPSMGTHFIKSLGELVGRAVVSHQDISNQ